jgi:hypothetical protein
MTKRTYAFAILIALALVANIPSVSMAQNTQSSQVPTAQAYGAEQHGQNPGQPPIPPAPVDQSQAGGGGRQTPQPAVGTATVIGVDQPENCLRIRSGPGGNYDVIGCAKMGDQLTITGVWTSNDWAQTGDNGWVYGPQIQTDLRPPPAAFSQSPSYDVTEDVTPDYTNWAYLPDYGYDTYWNDGLPIYFYNLNVWHRFHPWWWHRGHQAWWWQGGHHGRRAWNATEFRNFVRPGTRRGVITNGANISSFNRARTRRSFTTNRANSSSPTIHRFNANRFRSGSTNAFVPRNFSHPNRFRSGSTNAFRSRTFSHPQTFRSGNFGARNFSGVARSGGFGHAHFGGSGGHFRGGHFGGGGRRR